MTFPSTKGGRLQIRPEQLPYSWSRMVLLHVEMLSGLTAPEVARSKNACNASLVVEGVLPDNQEFYVKEHNIVIYTGGIQGLRYAL